MFAEEYTLKGRHEVLDTHGDLGMCCGHGGEAGPDESVQL